MLTLESTVHAVRLYHRGATVTRRLALPAEARGAEELRVPGLPLALLDPSVRLRALEPKPGDGALTITSVAVGLYARPPGDLPPEPDRELLEKKQREIRGLELESARLEAELTMLEGVPIPDRPSMEPGRPPPASPMAARAALVDFVSGAQDRRVQELRRMRRELRRLEEEVRDLSGKLARASSAGSVDAAALTKCVTARLAWGAGPAGSLALELDYYVPGARWSPAYQCRFSRDGQDARLLQRALICQRTGEDWRGVRLTLSTAAPLAWTELPRLEALRIGRAQPPAPARSGYRPPPIGAAGLFDDYDRGRAEAARAMPSRASYRPPVLELSEPVAPSRLMDRGGADAERLVEPAFDLADDEATGAGLGEAQHARSMAAPVVMAAKMMPAAAPAPKRPAGPRDGEEKSKKRARREVEAEEAEEAPAPELEVVVFQSLRLGHPDEAGERGRLVPVDRRRAYQRSLAEAAVRFDGDPLAAAEDAEARAAAVLMLPLPHGTVDVRNAAGTFDFAYEADLPVDVASDGAFHSVALGERPLATDVRYVVVPREDPQVFRIAHLENPLEAPLLPGPAEVYVDGEYVLTTRVPGVAARGRFEVGLGVEQAVRCARNTRFSERRSGSKVVATSELVHDLDIRLANNLSRAISVEVRERIPQPHGEAEVVVEEGRVEPPWEVYDQAERGRPLEGGRRWRVVVQPRSELLLVAEYVVKIYANNEIVGGNRREA